MALDNHQVKPGLEDSVSSNHQVKLASVGCLANSSQVKQGLEDSVNNNQAKPGLEDSVSSNQTKPGLEDSVSSNHQVKLASVGCLANSSQVKQGLEDSVNNNQAKPGLEDLVNSNNQAKPGLEDSVNSNNQAKPGLAVYLASSNDPASLDLAVDYSGSRHRVKRGSGGCLGSHRASRVARCSGSGSPRAGLGFLASRALPRQACSAVACSVKVLPRPHFLASLNRVSLARRINRLVSLASHNLRCLANNKRSLHIWPTLIPWSKACWVRSATRLQKPRKFFNP